MANLIKNVKYWKTWPLEPYFWKRSMLLPRKNPSLQLSCFKFPQIRPLKASNLVNQKTVLFWSELDSFRFNVNFTSYFAQTSSTDHIGSLKHLMQIFLTSPNIDPFVLTHPCKSVLVQHHQLICMEGLDWVDQYLGTLEMFACDVLDCRCDRLS